MSRRQYRIALHDADERVIEGARYTHVSGETPTPGLRIDLPQGTWFVHEVVATWSEDPSSRLLGSEPHYGGTLICRPEPPAGRPAGPRDTMRKTNDTYCVVFRKGTRTVERYYRDADGWLNHLLPALAFADDLGIVVEVEHDDTPYWQRQSEPR